MKILLATLCLNEMEHIPLLYRQHRGWPDSVGWVFVEAADRVYAECNPTLVSKGGLSTDGTTEYLEGLDLEDDRVTHVRHGISTHPACLNQGKCAARQRYLDEAEHIEPDWVLVLDADEFYTTKDQHRITQTLRGELGRDGGVMFRQRHIWRPPSIADRPLFDLEVVGGYWTVPHCRAWRWSKGMRYQQNHNWPETRYGRLLNQDIARYNRTAGNPECIHLGYASSIASRQAKHRYYVARGEGLDGRQSYVDCRRAFEEWEPGGRLPHGAKVRKYDGVVPEVFRDKVDL